MTMTDMNTSRDYNADSDALMGNTDGLDASGSGVKARVGEKVRELATTAQVKAGDEVRTQLDSGKTRAASALRGVADSLLHPNEMGTDTISEYIRTAGDRVQRAADYLENKDVREVVSDVESFARRQPALFLGGAFMLGLVAARVLKSSRKPNDMDGNDAWRSGSMYDRERSLDSYREPTTNFGNASMGTGGAALGGAMLGDNTGLGNDRSGMESGGLGNTGGTTGSAGYGSTGRTTGSSPYKNDLGTSSSDPSDLTTNE
jgi:hypothetical protein